MTVSGGAELKSFAATQPLSGLVVTADATLARGGADISSAMFDISGDLLLPVGMMLRMFSEPAENARVDLLTWSGTLVGSGTAWTIDARKPQRWAVETKANVVRALYTLPGTKLHLR